MSMGNPETATRRLNIAQSFNPMGSILGILVSKYFILLAIMVVMLFARMPEGKVETKQASLINTFSRLAKNKKYIWGVVAQFFYVGAQIGVWSFTIRLVMKELGYVEVHKHVWPEIIQCQREVGILDMQIYRHGRQLFMICDTVDDFDWDRDMARLATLPRQAEWEAYVSQFQGCKADARSDEKWKMMDRIF